RAGIKRRTHAQQWPVNPVSSLKPSNWPGWPEGKRFGLVLTHDVESEIGLSRAMTLARMEIDLGFRSSFNFIPEAYQTPPELRQQLLSAGFEVGVHGLIHDGKLY